MNSHYSHIQSSENIDEVSFEARSTSSTSSAYGNQNRIDANSFFIRQQQNRAIILFSLTTILLFADQNLMAPNLTAMAKDFGFTDLQRDSKLGGDIALAFFVLGAPAAYAVGILADSSRIARVKLFAFVVGLGEGACALTFVTRSYWELYICRAITGFSLGGALPLIYSILGDLYPADQRHMVSSLVGIGSAIGIGFGQGIAGFLGPSFGWRLPFLVVSIPALFCAAVVLLTVDEPERGGMEQAPPSNLHPCQDDIEPQVLCLHSNGDEEKDARSQSKASGIRSFVELSPFDGEHGTIPRLIRQQSLTNFTSENDGALLIDETLHFHPLIEPEDHCTNFQTLLRTPTVLLAILQGAPGCIPWGIANTYLNDFLAEDRGMTIQSATMTVLFFGIGNFFGMLLGGVGGGYLYRWDPRYPSLLAGGMAIMSCLCFLVLLNEVFSTSAWMWTILVCILTGVSSGTTGPIVKATLQNVTHPQSRGQAFALLNTFDDFGRGLGPVFVAALIKSMEGNRTRAFTVGTFGWMLCGFLNLGVYWTVAHDQERVQKRLFVQSLTRRGLHNSNTLEQDEGQRISHDMPANQVDGSVALN